MSVVDQRAPGLTRRLLVRALVVLGGVFAVTAIGWLLSATSAHADELPTIPVVPSVLSTAAEHATGQLPTVDAPSAADLKAALQPALHAALPARPSLDRVTQVTQVTQQVHTAVTSVSAPVTPPAPVAHHAAATPTRPAAPTVPAAGHRAVAAPSMAQHPRSAPIQLPGAHPATPAPAPAHQQPHKPLLPPVQPASSSDSSAHGATGFAGGPSGTSVPFTHVIGTGLILAGPPSAPRIAVAPGQQPGTSPD